MATANGSAAAGARAGGPLSTYLRETSSPLGAAALTLPLLTFHGLGAILAPEVRNGADLVSIALAAAFSLADLHGALPWAVFYAAIALCQAAIVGWLASRGRLSTRWLLPFLLECSAYALACALLASMATRQVLETLSAGLAVAPVAGIPLASAAAAVRSDVGLVDAVLISFGAGFHEELVFRLGLLSGLGARLVGPDWRSRPLPLLGLLAFSSVVFSAAHHIVEPFSFTPFVFRCAMGALFGGLFLVRGFAAAAWTHALYDIWILVLRG